MSLTTPPSKEQNKNDPGIIDPLVDRILRLSAAYGRTCDLPRVTVSWRLFGDSKKLDQLHAGKDLVTRRAEAALAWFAAHWPDSVEPPGEMVVRPGQPRAEHPLSASHATDSDVPPGRARAASPEVEPDAPKRPGFRFRSVGWAGSERSRREREISGPPKGESRADKVLRRFSWQDDAGANGQPKLRGRPRTAPVAEATPAETPDLAGPEPSAATRLGHHRPDPVRPDLVRPDSGRRDSGRPDSGRRGARP